jgi:hypothetical protein
MTAAPISGCERKVHDNPIGGLSPVEELRHTVDRIVVTGSGEGEKLGQKVTAQARFSL